MSSGRSTKLGDRGDAERRAQSTVSPLDSAPSSKGHLTGEMAENDGDKEVDVVGHDSQLRKEGKVAISFTSKTDQKKLCSSP